MLFRSVVILVFAFFSPLVVRASAPEGRRRLRSSAFAVPGTDATYDYIVVGGGSAGLTIASRLAEFASVAVIEAGGFYEQDNGNQSVVPFLGLVMPFLATTEGYPKQPLMDWGLVSSPQAGANNRKIHYAQGKTLGGSSAINTMAYLRGTLGSYQRWADIVGDPTYTFANLLQYFIKSTHFTPPNLQKRNTPNATVFYDPSVFDNSKGGPVQVSYGNWVDPTINWLSSALRALGLPLSPVGFNSGSLSGYGAWVTSTISPEDAERSTSQSSYLEQAIQNTGIMIYAHTQANKILFDSSKKASAVSVSTQGLEYSLSANKEVIVSAGVFHSPQLLMVSGIGPQATLKALGIPVLSDLPGVGQNLWDPVFFNVLWEVNTPSSGTVIAANPAEALEEYLNDAAGPYSSAGGYFAFEKIPASLRQNFTQQTASALAWFPTDWPEVEYIVSGFPSGTGSTIGAVSPTLLAPLSRGNVAITSQTMSDPPVINLGWLTDPADAEIAVAAFKRCRQIWNTGPAMSIRIGPELVPGAAVSSDADILSYIRQSVTPIWHASSTCSMGKAGDPMAVVDSTAKVFGVKGLRVVDISAFPFGVPTHPQGTVYMLAEKIADDIKNRK
ncbi:GMC oxidoreductase [Oidiodendron maius Zn]|uniref:GMC oxidoreductase n=1 Tax=Oidiodendron maius (strain Zn) TaxID=913774 RepID=A0A0C3CCL9_OIDMZ|nr:GMC oxidoreductase [Oidiodendron maius Zn]